jgi:adenosylcobinamide-GDP ribazoletransferase
MAVAPAVLSYARPEGIASGFLEQPASLAPGLALLVAAGLAAVVLGWPGVVAVGALVAAAAAVLALGRRRLGGFTGDVLGASAVVGETVGLLVAGARW